MDARIERSQLLKQALKHRRLLGDVKKYSRGESIRAEGVWRDALRALQSELD